MTDGTHHCLFDTAIGTCGIGWSEYGVVSLQLPERDRAATERRLRAKSQQSSPGAPPEPIQRAIADIQRYLTGSPVDFTSVALDLESVNTFNRVIYELLRTVGWGQTTSYGALARQAGSPDAARAVGAAMGANPVPIIIPCHRVLAKGKQIGGFSAYGGTITKERLLAIEGVGPDAPLLPLFPPAESRWG
jgi:methylated-DNA-[protein]-cysteine S-methyltransferase